MIDPNKESRVSILNSGLIKIEMCMILVDELTDLIW